MSGSTHSADTSTGGGWIDMSRGAMQQALEALVAMTTARCGGEDGMDISPITAAYDSAKAAIPVLRAALAEQAQPVAWAEQIIDDLHALHDTEMIQEIDSGDALIRLDDAIAVVEEARDRHTTPPAPVVPQPVAWLVEDSRYGAGENRLVVCDKHKANAFPVYTTPPAPQPLKPTEEMRDEFERWAAAYSTLPIERDDDSELGTTGYKDLHQTMLWHAWQAAKANAPVGASGGESGADAQLGLAGTDCNHSFAVQPSSGISICTKCGLSEMVAVKRSLQAKWKQRRLNNRLTELPPLPEHVATIGRDGHPRHVHHLWGVLEERHYGPPAPLFTTEQMYAYARAVEAEVLKRMGVQR